MQESIQSASRSTGEKPENKKKNRYKNILPCKQITANLACCCVCVCIFILFNQY